MRHSTDHTNGTRSHFLFAAGLGRSRVQWAASAALAGLLALAPASKVLSAVPSGEDKPPYTPKNEGFTRESMAELSRPEPSPAPKGPLVSPRVVRSEVDGKDFVPHRVSSSRRVAQEEVDGKDYNPTIRVTKRSTRARPDEQRIAARVRHRRRNPAESFVFWWNGWVIRTFHSRVGTVMLGTIGAQS